MSGTPASRRVRLEIPDDDLRTAGSLVSVALITLERLHAAGVPLQASRVTGGILFGSDLQITCGRGPGPCAWYEWDAP